MSETQEASQLPPHPLAFVIDGEVVLTMYTDERIAAVLQSEPTVIEYEHKGPEFDPAPGDKWDGTNFIKKTEEPVTND
jgi:hypothetical protein